MSAMASQITGLLIVYSKRLFMCRLKKTSKLHVTGLCVGNSPVTGEFPTQRANNTENYSISWRHHDISNVIYICDVMFAFHFRWVSALIVLVTYLARWTVLCSLTVPLTHWGRDKMAAISQTTFSNAFSSIKMFEFRLQFHWSLFLRVQLTIFQHWFR